MHSGVNNNRGIRATNWHLWYNAHRSQLLDAGDGVSQQQTKPGWRKLKLNQYERMAPLQLEIHIKLSTFHVEHQYVKLIRTFNSNPSCFMISALFIIFGQVFIMLNDFLSFPHFSIIHCHHCSSFSWQFIMSFFYRLLYFLHSPALSCCITFHDFKSNPHAFSYSFVSHLSSMCFAHHCSSSFSV